MIVSSRERQEIVKLMLVQYLMSNSKITFQILLYELDVKWGGIGLHVICFQALSPVNCACAAFT